MVTFRHSSIWGKLTVYCGLGLTALAAFEMGHKAIGAQDQTSPRPAPAPQELAIAPEPAAPPAAAIMDDAPANDSLTTKTAEVPDAAGSESAAATAEAEKPAAAAADDKTLAINSAAGDEQVRPNITNLSPEQFAIAAWAGASFPVENFQAYTSPFGYRRSATGGYRQEFHYGLDIAAPQGSYIRSWWSGRVVEVSDHTNCGTSVVVESGQWLHIYCHLQGRVETQAGKKYMIDRSAGVQMWEGQEVTAGDRIGRVGMTGRTTGPHLHWGLKYQGNWVDPAWVLRAMAVSQQAMNQQQ